MFLLRKNNTAKSAGALLALLVGASLFAQADEKIEACGLIENFGGHVQLISADRTVVSEPALHAPVPCGSWVSSAKGWLRLRHRDGFRVQLGAESFFQVKDGAGAAEQGVLYRGQAYVEAQPGAGELRLLTANGRAKVQRGPAVLLYDTKEEQTQLIALAHTASLENRFAPSRRITLRSGEMSSMNFQRLRVIPLAAAPASTAGLKLSLAGLNLSASEMELALNSTHKPGPGKSRGLASVKGNVAKPRKSEAYARHRGVSAGQGRAIKNHFVKKMTAGDTSGEELFFPTQSIGRSPSSLIQVEQPFRKQGKAEQAEKRKLIDELTRVRAE